MTNNRKLAGVVVLVAGAVLVLLGMTWKFWRSPQALWTRQEATEYTNAWRALKTMATSGLRRGDPNTDPKLAAAMSRYDAIKAKLDRAMAFDHYSGTVLVFVGITITAIGAWLLSSNNFSESLAAEA